MFKMSWDSLLQKKSPLDLSALEVWIVASLMDI